MAGGGGGTRQRERLLYYKNDKIRMKNTKYLQFSYVSYR